MARHVEVPAGTPLPASWARWAPALPATLGELLHALRTPCPFPRVPAAPAPGNALGLTLHHPTSTSNTIPGTESSTEGESEAARSACRTHLHALRGAYDAGLAGRVRRFVRTYGPAGPSPATLLKFVGLELERRAAAAAGMRAVADALLPVGHGGAHLARRALVHNLSGEGFQQQD